MATNPLFSLSNSEEDAEKPHAHSTTEKHTAAKINDPCIYAVGLPRYQWEKRPKALFLDDPFIQVSGSFNGLSG